VKAAVEPKAKKAAKKTVKAVKTAAVKKVTRKPASRKK